MKIYKKIVSMITMLSILSLNFTFLSNVNADYSYEQIQDNITTTSNEFNYNTKKKLDTIIYNLDLRLKSLSSWNKIIQIKKIKIKLWIYIKKQTKKSTKDQLKYLDYKLDELLYNLQVSSKFDTSSTLTTEDSKKIEDSIISLQKNLFNSSKTSIEKITNEFEKATNYTENWNAKFELNLNLDEYWSANTLLNLDNYIIKKSWTNQWFSSNITLTWWYNSYYESWSFNFKTFFDTIISSWDGYFMLKDTKYNFSDENIQAEIKKYLTKIQDWKYYKLAKDKNTSEFYESLNKMDLTKMFDSLNNFNLTTALTKADKILEQPLVKAYKKVDNKYYLVPTKYACDTYFDIKNQINPWFITSCSDSVYAAFLSKFSDAWDFYLEIQDGKNILGYTLTDTNDKVNWEIEYNDKWINKINFAGNDSSSIFSLDYLKNSWLTIKINSPNDVVFNFDWKLDENNNFSYIKSNINMENNFVWNLELNNWNLTWGFVVYSKEYNYNSWKYELSDTTAWKLTWNLDNFNIEVKSIDTSKKELFSANLNFEIKENYLKVKTTYSMPNYLWKNYTADLNLEIDQTNNNNNQNLYFNVNEWNKDILNINYSWKATRNYTKQTITIPTDYQEIDLNSYNNYDYSWSQIENDY